MKKQLLYMILILFQLNSYSQAPEIQWQKCYGGSFSERAYYINTTTDNGYIMCGHSSSNDGDVGIFLGGYDYWIIKTNSIGDIIWKKVYGGSSFEYPFYIQQTADLGYIIGGTTSSNNGNVVGNHGESDAWILKLDGSGNIVWKKTLGGSYIDDFSTIIQTNDGGYMIAAETQSNDGDVLFNYSPFYKDVWLVKLDTNGNIAWQRTLGGDGLDDVSEIKQTSDGGFIFVGYSNSTNGDLTGISPTGGAWVVKIDSSGNIVWQNRFSENQEFTKANSIKQVSDGGYIIGGGRNSTSGFDYWVLKLDSSGIFQWQNSYGGSGGDFLIDIIQTLDGGYLAAGSSDSINGDIIGNQGSLDVWALKISSTGNIQWQKPMGSSGDNYASSVKQTTDGGFIIAGSTNSNGGDVSGFHGGTDFWVIKLAPEQLSTINYTNVDFTIFPNPTNSILYLQFQNHVTIDKVIINDITGKKVLEQTQNNSQINVESLANGLYIIEAFSENKKFEAKFIKQ